MKKDSSPFRTTVIATNYIAKALQSMSFIYDPLKASFIQWANIQAYVVMQGNVSNTYASTCPSGTMEVGCAGQMKY